jgi:hypothetical protein
LQRSRRAMSRDDSHKKKAARPVSQRPWIKMNTNTQSKTASAHPRPFHKIAAEVAPPKADPAWKPEPCGLSREELRKIVAEILG